MNRDDNINFETFAHHVAMMQGDAIDLSESKYLGDDEPIIVRCTRDGLTFAVERAASLYDEDHPYECPLCRERRRHTQRMNRIRLKEGVRLRSVLELIHLL